MLARLARAVHLDCERIGNGAWQVTGGANAHVVGEDASSCDCFDHAQRSATCKHMLAVRLRLGDADTLAALRLLVAPPARSTTLRHKKGTTAFHDRQLVAGNERGSTR